HPCVIVRTVLSTFGGFAVWCNTGLGALITDAYVAARHDRRDGMLVDHLADRVAQQDDELVERLDRALQFDAVDQVDRYGNALAAQCIQEGVLQRLAFGHCCSPYNSNLCAIANRKKGGAAGPHAYGLRAPI